MKINGDLIVSEVGKSLLESFEIEEAGSNNNGSYIKLKNGVLICYGERYFSVTNSTKVGSLFYSGGLSMGNYPIAFKERPYCFLQSRGVMSVVEHLYDNQTSMGTIYLMNGTQRSNQENLVAFFAIGTWK